MLKFSPRISEIPKLCASKENVFFAFYSDWSFTLRYYNFVFRRYFVIIFEVMPIYLSNIHLKFSWRSQIT